VKRYRNKGCFITFEGIEGSGKSTQIRLVSDYIKKAGIKHIVTREPGGTELGNRLRQLVLIPRFKSLNPYTELCIMLAARADHVDKVINKNLEKGIWVLCDRFTDATVAYQGGGRGLDWELLKKLNRKVALGIRPDLTILLDLPVKKGLTRAKKRLSKVDSKYRESRFENEKTRFHEKVRAAYLRLCKEEPSRIKLVDATLGIDEIAARIRKIINNEFKHYKRTRKNKGRA
jgi:dTMP kinase